MSSKMLPKKLKHLLEIFLNLVVPETIDFYSQSVNDMRSQLVVVSLSLVYLAVDFYDQLLPVAVKISHEESSSAIHLKADRMLAQKLLAI